MTPGTTTIDPQQIDGLSAAIAQRDKLRKAHRNLVALKHDIADRLRDAKGKSEHAKSGLITVRELHRRQAILLANVLRKITKACEVTA